jgi:hypothetical protein
MRHVKFRRALRVAAALVALHAMGTCGGGEPSGPNGPEARTSFTGTAVLGDAGHLVLPYELTATGPGDLVAELSWSVTAPGLGRFGGNPPEPGLQLYGHGAGCSGSGSGFCADSQFSSSSPVHSGSGRAPAATDSMCQTRRRVAAARFNTRRRSLTPPQ